MDAKTAVVQYDMEGNLEREIKLPGIGTAYGFGAKKEDKDLYFGFTSFTTPGTIYKYDIASGESKLYRQSKVCLLYTSPSPRDRTRSRMPSSA